MSMKFLSWKILSIKPWFYRALHGSFILDRLRLNNKNEKKCFFILYCLRLALSLQKRPLKFLTND